MPFSRNVRTILFDIWLVMFVLVVIVYFVVVVLILPHSSATRIAFHEKKAQFPEHMCKYRNYGCETNRLKLKKGVWWLKTERKAPSDERTQKQEESTTWFYHNFSFLFRFAISFYLDNIILSSHTYVQTKGNQYVPWNEISDHPVPLGLPLSLPHFRLNSYLIPLKHQYSCGAHRDQPDS